MKQIATVINVEENEDIATVSVRRKSACDHCEMSGECEGVSCLVPKSNAMINSKAQNKIGAKVGDTVIVQSDDKQILLACFTVFIIPIIIAIISYIMAIFWLSKSDLNETISQILAIFIALVSMLSFFLLAKFIIDKKAKKKQLVIITQIITDNIENKNKTKRK